MCACGVSIRHHPLVRKDAAALSPVLRQDQEPGDHRRRPTERSGNRRPEAQLFAVLAQGLLNRNELSLDFNDQQRSRWFVPGQDVDGSALAALGVGDLGFGFPVQPLEPRQTSPEQP